MKIGKIEIFYFSGAGNSLHVAKELQQRIPDALLIPIVSLLGKDAIEINADTVGFVFPIHGMSIPIPVKKFLEKLDLSAVRYFFAAATRGGTKCFAFSQINKILKRKGKVLDSYFVLNMASNDPKFQTYDIPTSEKLAVLESEVQQKLDMMAGIVINKEKARKKI